tara:strand:+ start:4672 stop:5355 length:684 start_codon:yes stop_codon:yes gene_type:complete
MARLAIFPNSATWKVEERNQARRAYKHLKAQVRKQAHKSCVSAHIKRKNDVVVILNHAGWITDITPATEKLFGDLRGEYYYHLIDGSDAEKKEIGERLTSLISIKEELLYLNSLSKRKKGKEQAERGQVAEINIYPEFFDEETVDGSVQEVRHSTVIELEVLGWLGAWRMYRSGKKCMQDTLAEDLKKVKTNEEVEGNLQKSKEIAKETDEVIAELDKKEKDSQSED